MKNKKVKRKPDEVWLRMTPEERDKIVWDWIRRTKPEDLFPEGYRRAYENLTKAGLI